MVAKITVCEGKQRAIIYDTRPKYTTVHLIVSSRNSHRVRPPLFVLFIREGESEHDRKPPHERVRATILDQSTSPRTCRLFFEFLRFAIAAGRTLSYVVVYLSVTTVYDT